LAAPYGVRMAEFWPSFCVFVMMCSLSVLCVCVLLLIL
jgi:hypothetical protein